jgi:hypothetical protein
MAAACGHHAFGLVRRLGQWAVFAFARRAFAGLGLAAFVSALAEVVFRRRNMRILRGLAPLADQASNSEIRAAIRSIISCCASSNSFFSASVRT